MQDKVIHTPDTGANLPPEEMSNLKSQNPSDNSGLAGQHSEYTARMRGKCSLSFIGKLIGVQTVRDSTYWVPVDKIAGVENTQDSWIYKMFIEGKDSPILCYIDLFELSKAMDVTNSYKP